MLHVIYYLFYILQESAPVSPKETSTMTIDTPSTATSNDKRSEKTVKRLQDENEHLTNKLIKKSRQLDSLKVTNIKLVEKNKHLTHCNLKYVHLKLKNETPGRRSVIIV